MVERRPGARLRLVGRNPSPEVVRLGDRPGVEVVGTVPDVRPHVGGAALVVAPLRIARGVQNKVLEALAMGKAVLASEQAAEGLDAVPGIHLAVASSAPEWIEAAVGLLNDEQRRRRLGAEGRRYVEDAHRWDRCLRPFGTILGLPGPPGRTVALTVPTSRPAARRGEATHRTGGIVNTTAELPQQVELSGTGEGAGSEPANELPVTVIARRPGWRVVELGELWRYRELLYFLTWRDVKVRYKQTALGAAWAILQPMATMAVFSLVFARVAAEASSDIPYPLFVLAGLVPWTFFSNAVSTAGQSVVGSQNLVTKVYFPRLIIPAGAVGAGLVDFVISFAVLMVMMIVYGVPPGPACALVPLLALGLAVTAMGVGTLLSALTVAYRDFRHVVPFLVQLWMFATPNVYLQGGGRRRPAGPGLAAAEPGLRADRQLPGRGARDPLRPVRPGGFGGGRPGPPPGRLPLLPAGRAGLRRHHLTETRRLARDVNR